MLEIVVRSMKRMDVLSLMRSGITQAEVAREAQEFVARHAPNLTDLNCETRLYFRHY
ncbi:hypothetical protein PT2222_240100 [Paraburkholderia tropica]